MEVYSLCKNKENMYFVGKCICPNTIILSEVSQTQKDMHVCTHIQMNNNHNVQGIHTTFLGSEETKEGRGLIDDSAAKSTDFSCEGPEFKSQQAHGD